MNYPSLTQLKAFFQKNKAQIEQTFVKFLSFPTISADSSCHHHLEDCAEWLSSYLQKTGCTVELWKKNGAPVVFATIASSKKDAPTLLVYNHYDVQPVDPIDEWHHDPFEAYIENETVYARGAEDNKGQCMYLLAALKAFQETGGVPCHLKILIEGEEESGSTALTTLLQEKEKELQSDYTMVIDLGMRNAKIPAITLGSRGLVSLTVHLQGTNQDLHSGAEGGLAYNPLHAMVSLLARLRNDDGSIAVPGFYDEVKEPKDEDLAVISLSMDTSEWQQQFGQAPTGGEKKFPPLVRNWLRPTLELNGVHGGYGGPGTKTVITKEAVAKISCRLVPSQEPMKIAKRVKEFLLKNVPEGISAEITIHDGMGEAVQTSPHALGVETLRKAMAEVWGKDPEYILNGASIPIMPLLRKYSGGELIPWGFGLPTDHIHAPNERFDFARIEKGFLTLCLAMLSLRRKGS
jgi:acetylornithine deacetylase/succinyl-diaminopimelate desuccinylase-like protein